MKEQCPIMLGCQNLYKNCEQPVGCKVFPNCDFFKNELRVYCEKISKYTGLRKHGKILQCDKCKYTNLCEQSGFLKTMKKNNHNKIQFNTITEIKKENDKETKKLIAQLKKKGYKF